VCARTAGTAALASRVSR